MDIVYVVHSGADIIAVYTKMADARKDVKILGQNGRITQVSLRRNSIKEL